MNFDLHIQGQAKVCSVTGTQSDLLDQPSKLAENSVKPKNRKKSLFTTKAPLLASRISCCLLGALASGGAIAVDFSVSGHGGLDTNPHRLSSPLDPDLELFSAVDLMLSNRFENDLWFDASSNHAVYPNDDRGDWSKTEFDLGYESKFELKKKKFNYELSADWTDKDKNFVSRTTGEDATSGGESIVDRYDYDMTNLNAEISFKSEKKTRYRLRYQQRDKDYEDFSIPGLSDFDYSHDRYTFDVQFWLRDQHRVSAEIGATNREYDDRRVENLNGDEIPGTDLEYDSSDYALGYVYRPNKNFQLFLELSFSDRSDNGSGYRDQTYDRFYLSVRRQLNENESIKISLNYSEQIYDNRSFSVSEEDEEEDGFNSDGYQLKFDYRKNLLLNGEENLTFIFVLDVSDFDSSDSRYRYNREIVSVGIMYEII